MDKFDDSLNNYYAPNNIYKFAFSKHDKPYKTCNYYPLTLALLQIQESLKKALYLYELKYLRFTLFIF